MKRAQDRFLKKFKGEFAEMFKKESVQWLEGQKTGNLLEISSLKNDWVKKITKKNEKLEFGDIRAEFRGWTIIIEFDNYKTGVSNLIKFWPYLNGEISQKPNKRILICQFSNWISYGSHRLLWQWLLEKMQADTSHSIKIEGKQFNHEGRPRLGWTKSIKESLNWINKVVK